MSRENNFYTNTTTNEMLNAFDFNTFIKEEAERQFNEINYDDITFDELTLDEQQECILEQYNHQLTSRGWEVLGR